MISRNIKFNSEADIVGFVNEMSKQPYSVDLSRGCYVVDGKSILGVFGLGLGQTIRMDIHSDETGQLLQVVEGVLERSA